MNLNAYDAIHPKIDKKRTWINVQKCQLLSREIKFRPYVTLSKRYDKENNVYNYYVIMLDDFPFDRSYSKTNKDDYGRLKISLKSIWKESSLNYIEKDVNVSVELIESADDGDIYLLNI